MAEANIVEMLAAQYLSVEDLIRRYNSAKSSRASWDATWNIIQSRVFPNYRDYVGASAVSKTEPARGGIKNYSAVVFGLINSVVSEINSKLCDPSVKWMDLRFGNNAFNDNAVMRQWLYYCKEALYQLFADPSSGFYQSTYPFHLDWFTIGTACREVILRKDNKKIRFNTISMQDIFIELSGYGEVETTYRRFNLNARQAVGLWGENLHPSIIEKAKKESSSAKSSLMEFFEVVMPNPLKNEFPTLDWISCVIDKTNKNIVDIGLHTRNPYIISRFMVAPGETYGRSLVWYAMPNISAINRLSKRALQMVDYASLPVYLVKDAQSLPRVQVTPGAFIQGLDESGRPTIQPMQYGGDLGLLMEMYKQKIEEFKRCILAEDMTPYADTNKTATEVNSINIQMANRIRPPIVLLEYEELYRTIMRTLTLMQQVGMLPEFPYEQLGINPEDLPNPILDLRVTFAGQMFNMQRLQDLENSKLFLADVTQMAQVSPTILDCVNLDEFAKQDADIHRVSPSIINPDEQVQKIREERAAQQEEQAKLEQQQIQVDNLIKIKEAGLNGQVTA